MRHTKTLDQSTNDKYRIKSKKNQKHAKQKMVEISRND